jgi:hypothetical protein
MADIDMDVYGKRCPACNTEFIPTANGRIDMSEGPKVCGRCAWDEFVRSTNAAVAAAQVADAETREFYRRK